jgi:uncharacterized protein YecT (DUF1311 family)
VKRSATLAAGFPALLASLQLTADPCLDRPDMQQVQSCVRASARAAGDALDDAYRRLRERVAAQPALLERLRDVQQAWRGYRDAHLGARFPAANPRVEYGSVYPLCAALVARDFTQARAHELERWPGDCEITAGSRALAESMQAIRRDYADKSEFLAKLEAAQAAWEAFSRAESGAIALLRTGEGCGSARAAARAAMLDPWLRGVEEGDVCAGSVRIATDAVKGSAPTETIRGERKKTVGTIRELVNGDRACYVTLIDDDGERFDEMADFELCGRERELLGRRARLYYEVANVLAAACQGNMDCGRSDSVVLIRSAVVLPPSR